MTTEQQNWDTIHPVVSVAPGGAIGMPGLSPSITVQRKSDDFYLQSPPSSFAAGIATNTMSEVDTTNQPGLYKLDITGGLLKTAEGYYVTIVDITVNFFRQFFIEATVAEDEIWDAARVDHTGAGTFGEGVPVSGGVPTVADIVDGVWDELSASHLTPDSFGWLMQVMSGLLKFNARLVADQPGAYDSAGRLLSGKIRIYPSATDVEDDTNLLVEFDLEQVYNAIGNLTLAKNKRV